MRLYGYSNEGLEPQEVIPAKLAEITLCANADELRKIATFLESCAAEMDRMGAAYDHVHLSDRLKEFEASPHFVVAGARSE